MISRLAADPIVDLDQKAAQGIMSLLLRQALIQVASFAGAVILARLLSPSQFGVFAIATFLVNLFALLGDFGLAASLIQRRNDLTDHDLSVAFTVQQVFSLFVTGVVFFAAPVLVGFFTQAGPGTIWLVRALAINFYLTSWRSISVLQLERHLRFKGLAWIEALEVVVYQLVAVGLALNQFGVWSLVFGVTARALLGTAGLYVLAPYPVRLCLDMKLAIQILRFGIPFQSQSIVNSVGGWVLPGVGGLFLGPSGVGLLTWAASNGRKPLLAVESVMRVAFPHISRLQQDRHRLEQIVTRYLACLVLFSNLWLALVLTAGPSLVAWIYTSKWVPGLVALDLFALCLIFDCVTWVIGVSINALGSPGEVTRLMIVRTMINVVLSVPLVLTLGLAGIPLAYLLAAVAIIPRLWSRLADGALRRCVIQLGWLVAPLGGALGVGLALNASPGLSAAEHGITTALAVLASYVTISYFTAPDWLKGSVQSHSKRFVCQLAPSKRTGLSA